ncbi:hypothetical protein RRG08_015148 [Elysia crispata]|uniref:Uncharacterized protein n=1 Tax=Elysia crispata TaxID=231223 RepID=A0AAE1E8V1_9GAST|nr:hypothetical protein RRG08_015148 [Elysia crispata]
MELVVSLHELRVYNVGRAWSWSFRCMSFVSIMSSMELVVSLHELRVYNVGRAWSWSFRCMSFVSIMSSMELVVSPFATILLEKSNYNRHQPARTSSEIAKCSVFYGLSSPDHYNQEESSLCHPLRTRLRTKTVSAFIMSEIYGHIKSHLVQDCKSNVGLIVTGCFIWEMGKFAI